ncbi:hypothetical protein HCJ76_44120 [Streptomyces sp. MC1]|uniref:hypothetical protein n=1 Tax=Streptomyces sp. MC1 TaxID=295105 RepID=UPI0018CA8435|nr:hypothetical protein [Streptomyces sp. MC1]MBG7704871.1 hypothetical protein [Streptomyces sp. MC1]
MAITLAKPDYYAIVNGDGEVLTCEPVPATPEEREELKVEAHIACLTIHEVTAPTPEAAMEQARRDIAAQIADDIANESPDTPAEAALRGRRMISVWLDRI